MPIRNCRIATFCLALVLTGLVAACTDSQRNQACSGDFLLNASGEIARVGVEEFNGLGLWADSTDIALPESEIDATAAHFRDELDAIERQMIQRRAQPCFAMDISSTTDDRRATDELARVRQQIDEHRQALIMRSPAAPQAK